MRNSILMAAALFLTLGCSSDSTGPGGGASVGAFEITIGSGVNPTYAWQGTTAHSVSVMRVSAPTTIVWGVASFTQAIPSSVRHGTVPASSLVSANIEPTLTPGVAYRVSITLKDSKTAYREFTP